MALFSKVTPTTTKPSLDVSTTSSEERILKLEQKVRKLENEVLDCITALDSIRNKVLRKIQIKKDEDEPENQKVYKPGQAYF